MRLIHEFFEVYVQTHRLGVTTLHHLPHFIHDTVRSSNFLVTRVHVLVDFTIKTTSSCSDFASASAHLAAGHVFFFFFITKLFEWFLDDVPLVVLLLFLVCSEFHHLVQLCFAFGTFLATLIPCVFSSLLEMSPAHPSQGRCPSICPELSRSSIHHAELCPASSTTDDRPGGFGSGNPIFPDHPVCLSVMALFNIALFFSLLI